MRAREVAAIAVELVIACSAPTRVGRLRLAAAGAQRQDLEGGIV